MQPLSPRIKRLTIAYTGQKSCNHCHRGSRSKPAFTIAIRDRRGSTTVTEDQDELSFHHCYTGQKRINSLSPRIKIKGESPLLYRTEEVNHCHRGSRSKPAFTIAIGTEEDQLTAEDQDQSEAIAILLDKKRSPLLYSVTEEEQPLSVEYQYRTEGESRSSPLLYCPEDSNEDLALILILGDCPLSRIAMVSQSFEILTIDTGQKRSNHCHRGQDQPDHHCYTGQKRINHCRRGSRSKRDSPLLYWTEEEQPLSPRIKIKARLTIAIQDRRGLTTVTEDQDQSQTHHCYTGQKRINHCHRGSRSKRDSPLLYRKEEG